MANPWDKIFENKFDEAYQIADDNFLKLNTTFDLRARATIALLLNNYESALADFLTLNNMEKTLDTMSDGTFMELGICYYALGEMENAVSCFKYPLANKRQVKYTSDVSVLPCMLLFIGLKLNNEDLIKIATKELKRLSKYKTAGPNYLLGNISEPELEHEFRKHSNETLRNRDHCKVEFYKAIK